MGNPVIVDDGGCSIEVYSGPTKLAAPFKYTIGTPLKIVVRSRPADADGAAQIVAASYGTIKGGDAWISTPQCSKVNNKVVLRTYIWSPPSANIVEKLASLCGHSRSKSMSSSSVSISLDCTDNTSPGCPGAPVLTCAGAEVGHQLCTGSPGSANLQLNPPRALTVCGFASDGCVSKRAFCCIHQTIAPDYDVVVVGSGLAGSATAAALAHMLDDRGLNKATVALLDASPEPDQGGGSTSVYGQGVAWFPNTRHPSQVGCDNVLAGQSDWVEYIEGQAGDTHHALVQEYVATANNTLHYWDTALGGMEVLPVHQWSYADADRPDYDPAAILSRSTTGAACWPDYHGVSRNASGSKSSTASVRMNVSGNVFHRGATHGNWQKRTAAHWLSDLAAIRTQKGGKRRHPLWTGHTVVNVTMDGRLGYVLTVRDSGSEDRRTCLNLQVRASKVVFASGGFGAKVYPEHHVSVDANTGLARDVAVRACQA